MGDDHLVERALDQSFDDISNDDLAEMVLDYERLHGRLQALQSAAIAELQSRRFPNRRTHRSERQWMAASLHLSSRHVGYRFNRAELLAGMLSPAAPLLMQGRISTTHVDRLARLTHNSRLIEPLERDLPTLLVWAETEPWPKFVEMLDAWSELMDTIDPAELDERNLDRRGIAWAQGLDGEVLAEIDTTAINWQLVLSAAQPIYDRMLAEEWDAAKSEHGEQVNGTHLGRSDRQRWHDAFFEVFRRGVANLETSPDGAGPSPSFSVNVTVDYKTLQDEALRLAGETPAQRPPGDARSYRCETEHGLRITPSTALRASLAGTIRRITLGLSDLDFSVSRSARLFRGPLRLGLLARDRHCQHPGCDTPGHRCEADHIVPHSHGGETVPTNGQLLCRPCHRHKTRLEAEGLLPPPGR